MAEQINVSIGDVACSLCKAEFGPGGFDGSIDEQALVVDQQLGGFGTSLRSLLSIRKKAWEGKLLAESKLVTRQRRGVEVEVANRNVARFVVDSGVSEGARCIARFPLATRHTDPDTVWAQVRRSYHHDGDMLVGLEFDTPLDTLRIAPGAVETTAGYNPHPHRILVVDDKRGIRSLLTRYLGDRGFHVDTAGDGEEAFLKVKTEPPDVMLLDLYLPQLNGHDLLRRMQETNIAVELIFTMSGYAHTSDALECLRLGAVDHLLKPLDLEHLHRSIVLRLGAHPA